MNCLQKFGKIRCFEKILFIIFLVAETGSEKFSDTCCCTLIPMKKFDEMNAPLGPPDGGQRSVKNNVYYSHIKNRGNVLKINIKGQNN